MYKRQGSNGEPNWSYIPSKGKSTKKVNNRTYQFADEKTKKQIAYMSGYYLQTVPQSVKAAWQETLEETCLLYTSDSPRQWHCRICDACQCCIIVTKTDR